MKNRLLAVLCLTLSSSAFATKSSVWCDSRVRGWAKTYMVTFKLDHDEAKSTCTATGDSGEFAAGADHEFACRIDRVDNTGKIFRIELDVTKTTNPSGDPGRFAEWLRIYHDFDGSWGQGLAGLKDGTIATMTCRPG